MMEEVKALEKAISDLAFDNLMKQKAINQEHYSLQACEKALEVVKHEDSNVIIERNEHRKTESFFEIQSRSYNSHLNSLGDSCQLMDDKRKLLLEEIIIVENKFQEISTSFNEELMGYKTMYKEFEAAYGKLREVFINKAVELNITALKKLVTEFKEKIYIINFELERNDYLQGQFAVIWDAKIDEQKFFFSIGESLIKRIELEKKLKDCDIVYHYIRKSLENDCQTHESLDVHVDNEFRALETLPAVTYGISLTKVSDELSFQNEHLLNLKLDSPPPLGLTKVYRPSRKYQEANSSELDFNESNKHGTSVTMNVAVGIKKLKLASCDNMLSLSFPKESQGTSKHSLPKKVNIIQKSFGNKSAFAENEFCLLKEYSPGTENVSSGFFNFGTISSGMSYDSEQKMCGKRVPIESVPFSLVSSREDISEVDFTCFEDCVDNPTHYKHSREKMDKNYRIF